VSAQWGIGQSLKQQALDKLLKDCVTKFNKGEELHAITRDSSYAPRVDELLKQAA
jgi:hypothetical protein